jgi:hypothetical protein
MKPLAERPNKVFIERDQVSPDAAPALAELSKKQIVDVIERVKAARAEGKPVMLAHGAHAIKNCLAPVMIKLMEEGWVTHLATNGAGIIHDWEFAFQGQSSEDVRANVARGEFGNWQETGYFINLALNVGAYEGKGYGESVGAMIWNERLAIPSVDALRAVAADCFENDPDRAAAAIDLAGVVRRFGLKPGDLAVAHPWKRFSVQAAAYRLGVPYTGHPMIGHDIIYNHPMNHCALLGRAAQRDFLAFANNISQLDGGVYLSIGSAVMSPMIFEKSLSISQNVHIQRGGHIDRHFIQVVDLAESRWDWTQGEPPMDNPDYYLRYNKTFNRMGGAMRYMTADNRDFLLALWQGLKR